MKLHSYKGSIQLVISAILSVSSLSSFCADSGKSDTVLSQLRLMKSLVLHSLELPKIGVPSIKVEKKGLDLSSSAYLHMNSGINKELRQSNYLFTDYLDLTHRDHLLFYELEKYELENSEFKINLGLNIMKFNNNIRASTVDYIKFNTQEIQNNDVGIDKYTAALYLRFEYTLSGSDICIASEASVHDLGERSIYDYKLFINISTGSNIDTEIGIHSFDAKWKNIDDSLEEFSFQGYYARVSYNF